MRAGTKVAERAAAALAVLGMVCGAGAQEGVPRAQLVVQTGHADGIDGVAFSADGRIVATASNDHSVRLWDAASGALLRIFTGHTDDVKSVAISADGKEVLSAGADKTARLWDAASGKTQMIFAGHTDTIHSAIFSPDGRSVLTGSEDNTARLWDVASGKEIRRFEPRAENQGDVSAIWSVAFSPDGRTMVTSGWDARAVLWDVATGKELRRFRGHSGPIKTVALSPDGRLVLTGSDDKTARLWDAATGEEVMRFAAEGHYVASAKFSPDGRMIATGGDDATARIWDAKSGKELHRFEGHKWYVEAVAFSPDGKELLTGTEEEAAQLWEISSGKLLLTMEGRADSVRCVAYAPDGTGISTGSNDKEARVWDMTTGKQVERLTGDTLGIGSVAYSADGKNILTASDDKTARLWDAASGKELKRFEGHTDIVSQAVFSPNGKLVLTGSWDKTVRLWDKTGAEIEKFGGPSKRAFAPDLPRAEDDIGMVSSVAFAPDGETVTASGEYNKMYVWNVKSGELVRKIPWWTEVQTLAISPDGQTLLTGGLRALQAWNAKTGELGLDLRGHTELVDAIAFSKDSKYALTGSLDQTARLWQVESGKEVQGFTGNLSWVNGVAFSPDEKWVLTGGSDGTARIFNRATGEPLVSLFSFTDGGWAVVDALGRFDTSDLDGNTPLHWIVADDPFHALPLEIFMRDYYTPGLLARVMKGEKLPEVRSIAEIKDRVQPEVKVLSVTPAQKTAGRVDVVVHAASVTDAKGVKSGLQDLRLFRDGQMVADGYREGALQDGDFVFRDVMLKSDVMTVTFTAYAFNSERIKSATASLEYEVKTPAATVVKRRAFLLQVGVNHTAAKGCELKYSVNDAEKMSAALTEKLRAQGFEVEAVKLESDPTHDDKTVMNGAPSKGEIRKQLAEIAAKATPDDVFFMSFSGHGYSAPGGEFFVLPADVAGSCADAAALKNMISADELAEWLRPIDAGEMTLILDACYSAESVQAGDFKPGPMGSRGLGQMAYDKRMRVLAASQSDAVAHEYDYLHQGLLSYVLVQAGLENSKADWKPKDGKITAGEWLSYAAAAVPEFKPAAPTGENKGTMVEKTSAGTKAAGQVPALFDFSRADTLVLETMPKQ